LAASENAAVGDGGKLAVVEVAALAYELFEPIVGVGDQR
jgi:hypothetical protein